jgi:hypothetical protein
MNDSVWQKITATWEHKKKKRKKKVSIAVTSTLW